MLPLVLCEYLPFFSRRSIPMAVLFALLGKGRDGAFVAGHVGAVLRADVLPVSNVIICSVLNLTPRPTDYQKDRNCANEVTWRGT
jgi:hypothetical protein